MAAELEQIEQQQPLTERNVTADAVYRISLDTNGPTGELTELGKTLNAANPALVSMLVRQAQGEAYLRCDALYPPCAAISDEEVAEYRRDRPIGDDPAPAATKSSAKPELPTLQELFGPKSDGRLANNLGMNDLPTYRRLREQAIAAGMVGPPVRPSWRKY